MSSLKRCVLSNGLTVLVYQRPSKVVTFEVCVKVGSNQERKSERGVSHFIEHMVFEGTVKRPNAMQISNEIESIGGEFNAATTYERTLYYATVLKKHFGIAVDVISDMMLNPLFDTALIDKERKVILDEIKLVTDDPKNHQWVLFNKALLKNHPSRNPIYGEVVTVSRIMRKNIQEYFKHYYVPSNMMLIVVGDVALSYKQIIAQLESAFSGLHNPLHGKGTMVRRHFSEPPLLKPRLMKERKNLMHSYVVYGYKTVQRLHPDSYVLDVIRAHLGRGQSGTLFNEIRTKRGLAYDVGVYHYPSFDYGFFATYFGTDKKNIPFILSLIKEQLSSLDRLGSQELRDAQTFIEGDFIMRNEDSSHCADSLAHWETMGDVHALAQYVTKIHKVTMQDIQRVAQRYFSQPYALASIEQKK